MKFADGRHLRDDQMIAVYIGAEPRFGRRNHLDHLQWCAACARRYEAFIEQVASARDEANDEADAIFTPARLEAQRQQILARLEHAGHAARVIRFPSPTTQRLSIFTGNQVRRWTAVAAAAGLIIGLTLGRMSDLGSMANRTPNRAIVPTSVRPVETVRPTAEGMPNEEEILSRADQAQNELQVPAELEALGAITPFQNVALRFPPGR